MVTRVIVDNGSSANICPLSTMQKLKIDTERLHKNNICVRGFDGGGKDYVGNIVLELTIGPVEFTMEFLVLNVAVFYNLLLGWPWIHVAKAVWSFLHQMVKLEWTDKKSWCIVTRTCVLTMIYLSRLLRPKMIRALGLPSLRNSLS